MAQRSITFQPNNSVPEGRGSLLDICNALATTLKTFLNLDYDLDVLINPASGSKSVFIIGLPDIDGNKTRYGLYFNTSLTSVTTVDLVSNMTLTIGYGVLRPDESFDYVTKTCVPYTLAGATGTQSNSITSTIYFDNHNYLVFFDTTNELMQARGLCFMYAGSDADSQKYLNATVVSCWNTIIKCTSVATGSTDHLLLYYPSGNNTNRMIMLSPNGQDAYIPPKTDISKDSFFTISQPYASGYIVNNIYVGTFSNGVINGYFNTFTTITDESFYDGLTINNIHYKGSWAYPGSTNGVRFFIADNS